MQWISCPLGQVRQPNTTSTRTVISFGQTITVGLEEVSEAIPMQSKSETASEHSCFENSSGGGDLDA